MVIDVFEHATALFINAGQGKWPELAKKHAVFVNSSLGSDGLLKASISYDPIVFNREVEYAFYINIDGKRIFSKWYSDSPNIEYKINTEAEMVDAVYKLGSISRSACRMHALKRFDVQIVAKVYLDIFNCGR
jgi:hypothetical protein